MVEVFANFVQAYLLVFVVSLLAFVLCVVLINGGS
jgi:hypothetical protein